MRLLRMLGMALLMLSLSACGKKEPTNADRIIGTWELTKPAVQSTRGNIVEFTKNGKLFMTVKVLGKDIKKKGDYEVDDDTLTVTHKEGTSTVDVVKQKIKIKTLNETTLVTVDDEDNVDEFTKQ